ncbi:hypothetical protein [Wolbachia endosymbiont (group A) of Myopa testacea]
MVVYLPLLCYQNREHDTMLLRDYCDMDDDNDSNVNDGYLGMKCDYA